MGKIVFVFSFFILFGSCQKSDEFDLKPVKKSAFLLGTRAVILLVPLKGKNANNDIKKVFSLINKFQQIVDPYIKGTVLHTLNKKGYFKFNNSANHQLVYHILTNALEIAKETKGAFNPVILPLSQLWGFSGEKYLTSPPLDKDIARAKLKSDYRNISIKNCRTIVLKNSAQLDLGAIAKGTAIQLAASMLKKMGYKKAIIDFGGDVFLLGKRYNDGTPAPGWFVAIKHPRDNKRNYCILLVKDRAVVSSGDYERFFIYKNKRYHHILDPKKGWPVEKCVSATVVGPSAEKADAYATAIFVLGPKKGIIYINTKKNYEAMILTIKDRKIHPVFSSNFVQKFNFEKCN